MILPVLRRRWFSSATSSSPRRVVVTGIGAVTPLGLTWPDSWRAVLQNECGVTSLDDALEHQWPVISNDDYELSRQFRSRVAAPVRGLPQRGNQPRHLQMALTAGLAATKQAKLLADDFVDDTMFTDLTNTSFHSYYPDTRYWCSDPARAGAAVACCLSLDREFVAAAEKEQADMRAGRYRLLSRRTAIDAYGDIATDRFFKHFGLLGPQFVSANACAASSEMIIQAYRSIVRNEADVMLAGGTEAGVHPFSMAAFEVADLLATDLAPAEASRPFDQNSTGFVMGEGAAILVLEELQHALRRNVPILAELSGCGFAEPTHLAQLPAMEGLRPVQAMKFALEDAGIEAGRVDYINANAISDPKADAVEAQAIERVFANSSSRPSPLRVSSTKGATAHAMGAAGAMDAAFTVQALLDQTIPPTRNLEHVDKTVSYEHVREVQRVGDGSLDVAMSNNFAFNGGLHTSLVFQQWKGD